MTSSADIGRDLMRRRVERPPRWGHRLPPSPLRVAVAAVLTVAVLATIAGYATAGAAEHDPDDWCTVTVEAGDTMTSIMAGLGFGDPTAWRALAAANPHIGDPDHIVPGDRLHVCYRGSGGPVRYSAPVVDWDQDRYSYGDLVTLAAHVGFPDPTLWAAIFMAESAGDPCAVGDVDLETDVWGPSVSLAQVRTLREQTGTGGPRDVTQLCDARWNLDAAFTISSNGTDPSPWSAFGNGSYRDFLP